ncbi:hypothetical protein FDENT_3015 [Fusarium denticulatum]|uniref:Uncharacterized protein n=1 Tax=Fusarium denticulatum TaxID=48507 RepID=A0A8H5XEK1_9HYPO|nr:hypothetical protein FDENT_3015 [Fusarium denticulatum]
MPTSTEFFGVTAHNLGPLTTTFTAPSACAAATDHHVIVNGSAPTEFWGQPTCGIKDRGSCMPNGKSYDSLRSVTTPLNRVWYHYYSPGIACPSGWTTAGNIVKDGDSSLSASGVFSRPVRTATFEAQPLEPSDFWGQIMNVSETIALCCPRYSSELVVATWVPAVPLVHQQSDLDEAEEDDGDDDENDDGDDGDSEGSDGNAASTKALGNGVVSVLGLTLGILAGMGMLL